MKKWMTLILTVALLLSLPVRVYGAEATEEVDETTVLIQRAIQYYEHYQEDAWDEIEDILSQLAKIDPEKGDMWRQLFRDWSWCNTEMPVYEDVLPDGLAQDDSLCIVILGYALNSDGSMQEELLNRLRVGLDSARKYPNAYVAVCGGGTASNSDATEADTMAAWLMEQGIAQERIIVENSSMSTTENALYLIRILINSYPGINKIALATSDYHMPWAASSFLTRNYRSVMYDGEPLELVANAVAKTDKTQDTMFSQAWGVSILMDIPYETGEPPALYVEDETLPETTRPEPVETQPEAIEEPVAEEKSRTWIYVAVGALLVPVVLFFPRKKPKRRQRPQMQWDLEPEEKAGEPKG